MVQSVLLPRYALYFHLLRIDVAAMWLFVFSSSVILFGFARWCVPAGSG